MHSDSICVDATTIATVSTEGTDGTVLLFHGNSLCSREFTPQLTSDLGRRYRLVAFDLPGHGGSDRPAAPRKTYGVGGLRSLFHAAVKQLGVNAPVLVGHSLGGHLAVELLPLLPDCRGVLLFGAPPLRSAESLREAFLPAGTTDLVFKEQLTDDEVARFAGTFADGGGEAPPEACEWIRSTDPAFRPCLGESAAGELSDEAAIVREAACPIAIVHGAYESVVSLPYICSLPIPRLWRGAVQVIGGGHCCHWEHPDAFNRILGDFLRDVFR
ncbi:MAG: alpha/beta fold hydrolase [Chitinivibrionales bacterium]|nr:alpha/beta fold hydrolase [Chitinivibrionales bacterium]